MLKRVPDGVGDSQKGFSCGTNKTLYVFKQDCITAKDPCPLPPWRFLYLIETKSWWCGEGEEEEGEGEEGENVHLLTHATARGVGKNRHFPLWKF